MDVVRNIKQNRIKVLKIFADGGYTGKLIDNVEIVKRNEQHERTFSWIDTNQRKSKNYERLNQNSITMIHLSAIRIMLNRF